MGMRLEFFKIEYRFIQHDKVLPDHPCFVIMSEKPCLERNATFDFFEKIGIIKSFLMISLLVFHPILLLSADRR